VHGTEPTTAGRGRRIAIAVAVFAAQFALFEAGMRSWGGSEASPTFQRLFMDDPVIGYRLQPGARTRFRTAEFVAEIAINEAGVRDDAEIGPKAQGERRIVILGDSLVLSVQVDFPLTFGALLEDRLNRAAPDGLRYRVINAGVQGYGPVEELLFFRTVAKHFEPDVVLVGLFVGNDAEEAVTSEPRLRGETRPAVEAARERLQVRMRRLVRRSMVLQVLRLRLAAALDRLRPQQLATEPPLQSYAANPAPRIARGIALTVGIVEAIAEDAAAVGARTGVVLMPARLQVDDGDYGRLREIVRQAGGELVRDAATDRFDEALASLPLPRFDLLPDLRRTLPGPDLFFQQTIHFTPHGHEVVAAALERFLRESGLLDEPAAGPR
jgi:lysophospholipase L1-like esterase